MSKLELRAASIAVGSTILIMGTPIVGLIVAGELAGIAGMLNYLAAMAIIVVLIAVSAGVWLLSHFLARSGRWLASEKTARGHEKQQVSGV